MFYAILLHPLLSDGIIPRVIGVVGGANPREKTRLLCSSLHPILEASVGCQPSELGRGAQGTGYLQNVSFTSAGKCAPNHLFLPPACTKMACTRRDPDIHVHVSVRSLDAKALRIIYCTECTASEHARGWLDDPSLTPFRAEGTAYGGG